MFQKSILSVMLFVLIGALAVSDNALYAFEGMSHPMAREVTPEDDTLAWTTPASWKETAPTGMRLASFASIEQPEAIDVSIVLLGTGASEVEPNVKRWAGQINITAEEAAIKKMIQESETVKTGLGLEAPIFDFSSLQSGQERSAKSMVVSMISLESAAVFVKMTGSLESIAKNKASFKELVISLHKKK